ncbi:MAG TPA: MFS transporter [Steroidobacteraceae bacterium]|nr:MFS transporter [Steroidobacteraceae bacterium]
MKDERRRLTLLAVLSSSLGVGLTFGFQPPLIALVLERGGSSSFAIGAVTSASLIAVIALGPVYPLVIARLGLRRSVMLGIACGALILSLMPLMASVPFWFCLRFLTGCTLGLSWIASEIWLNTVSGADARGTVMGVYGTVFSLGTVAGPSLLEFTGTHGWLPFAVGAVALIVTLAPLAALENTASVPQGFTPPRELMGVVRAAPLVMLAALVAGLVESADLTLLPLFGLRSGFAERTALLLLAVFMAGNVVLQAPIGLLADRFGRRLLLGACALASALGPLLLQPFFATPALLWPLLFVWGGTLYAFYSQGVALLGAEFPSASLATANTVFVMVYCLGGVIGPSAGGLVLDRWPAHGLPVLLSAAALLLLAGVVMPVRGVEGREVA